MVNRDSDTMDNTTTNCIAEPPLKGMLLYSLPILDCIDKVQGLHGVPIGDYSSYRSYCTRRLRRLRTAVPHVLSHASKYAVVKSPRRHGYCPRTTIPDPTQHENVLWHYLFLAERAWAHAHLVRKQKGRRFNKAAKWSGLLHEAATMAADEETQRQTRGYTAWMQGNAALEHHEYAKAYGQYQECRRCWAGHERVESTLQPLIRYCQYEANLDDDDTNHHQGTTTTNNEEEEEEDPLLRHSKIILEFRGQKVALDSHQQLALLYLKMQTTMELGNNDDDDNALDEGKLEQLLVDLNDALQLVPSEPPPLLIVVREYLEFTKRRYWQLLQETSREPSADLYEALQENAQRMALDGRRRRSKDGNTDDDDDDDEPDRLLATAHAERFRALKCFYLAVSHYEEGSAEQWTLLRHAKKLCKNATEEMVACEDDETDLDAVLHGLEQLDHDIDLQILRCETTHVIMGGGVRNRPLWMRLDQPDGSGPLVDDPPKPLPLAAKGIFFDMAWSHVAASTEGLRPKPKPSSFLGRWFFSSNENSIKQK
jgi:RNA-binding signal recognition particle 68